VFLLDTNIVSELVKRTPDLKVTARLARESGANLFISTVTVFELRFGAARAAKPASLWTRIQRDIVARFQVIPFSEADALTAADLMAPLSATGRNLALQDIWLAGVALNRNFIFVTRNSRDFVHFPGLRLENWFQ
jgi:predicted nucleic acid-binding protein